MTIEQSQQNSDQLVNLSKALTYALRHRPKKFGLTLDGQGWCSVDDVMTQLCAHGHPITRALLQQVVDTSDKKRFAISEDGLRIRANQGHTAEGVELTFKQKIPPPVLYHGTVEKALKLIEKGGLSPMKRHHVHLSATVATATDVGGRRGAPIILIVDTAAMVRDGFKFFISENDVWLTDAVPPRYLRRM